MASLISQVDSPTILRDQRPSIDGLRAVSVILIVFFHFNRSLLPGAFTAVDLFFVISGFLITRNILEERARGAFKFSTFYVKRLCRLAPAFLTTVLVTLLVGFFILSPRDLAQLAKSSFATVCGYSNVFFFHDVRYFELGGMSRPLLHTWSLAVEEQFYFVWPLLVVGLYALRKTRLMQLAFVVIVIAATAAAELSFKSRFDTMAFYLTPFRAGEFAVGALGVLADVRISRTHRANNLIATAGVILLGSALLWLDAGVYFPGAVALLPTFGALGIIFAGERTYVGRALANKALVYVGRLSYPIYLVQWPILVFQHYWTGSKPDVPMQLLLSGSILLAGAALHHLVEVPLQRRRDALIRRPKRTFAVTAAVVAALALTSRFIVNSGGFPWRVDTTAETPRAENVRYGGVCALYGDRPCDLGSGSGLPTALLAGDSQALHLMHGLNQYFRERSVRASAYLSLSSCLFLSDVISLKSGRVYQHCEAQKQKVFAELSKRDIPLIIGQNWTLQASGPVLLRQGRQRIQMTADLLKTMLSDSFRASPTQRIIIFGQIPEPPEGYATCWFRPKYIAREPKDCATFEEDDRSATARTNATLAALIREFSLVTFIDPTLILCPSGKCLTTSDRDLLYIDQFHLSENGSKFLIRGAQADLSKALGLSP